MTATFVPPVAPVVRRTLVDLAGDDLTAALEQVVPFVLAHPSEAGVLVELGAIAARSETEWRAFRLTLRALFRAVEA